MRRLLFLNGIKAFEAAARSGSFAGAISLRDHAKAKANVLGVEHSMALENQASGHLKQAIDAEATRLASKRRRK